MRINIVINDKLMRDALKVSGLSTKKQVVEEAPTLLVRRSQRQQIRELRGKLKWESDINENTRRQLVSAAGSQALGEFETYL